MMKYVLKALALGSIGDSFAELDQLDDALDAYRSAANLNVSDNEFYYLQNFY